MKFEKWFYEDINGGFVKDIDNITEDEMHSVKTGYVANLILLVLWSIFLLLELWFEHWSGSSILLPLIFGIQSWLRAVRLNEIRKPMSDSRKMRIRNVGLTVIIALSVGGVTGTLLFNPSVAWKCVDIAFMAIMALYVIGSYRHWKKVDEERKR